MACATGGITVLDDHSRPHLLWRTTTPFVGLVVAEVERLLEGGTE
jgi:hypothetical protein